MYFFEKKKTSTIKSMNEKRVSKGREDEGLGEDNTVGVKRKLIENSLESEIVKKSK